MYGYCPRTARVTQVGQWCLLHRDYLLGRQDSWTNQYFMTVAKRYRAPRIGSLPFDIPFGPEHNWHGKVSFEQEYPSGLHRTRSRNKLERVWIQP
jgi:hypothetical protein